MKTAARIIFGAILIVTILGCSSTQQRKAVAFMTGELLTEVDAPLEATLKASEGALRDLDFYEVRVRADALNGVLTAKTAAENQIRVTLDKYTTDTTRIGIRVGTLGDERISHEILSRIKRNIG